jgi:hypothetical protein
MRYEELVQAVRDHSGMDDEQIREAGEHGADAGWPGFTYTADGADFTRTNRELVWAMLQQEADDFGADNVPAYVAGFARADMAESADGFDCLLAWWALETAGRWLEDNPADDDEPDDDPPPPWDGYVWVCDDCYTAHHYGAHERAGQWFAGESDTPSELEPLGELARWCELADATDLETGAGLDGFSRSSCDGCGSRLGGARSRLAYKERAEALPAQGVTS